MACNSAPQWADPGTAPRGNATTARQWLDTTNSWLETHTQYDQLGNVRYARDARGNLSEVSYLDSFCNRSGGGCDGTYTPNTFAFATSTKTPKPDPTGAYGSTAELTTSTVYDYYTGHVYSTADANGQTTTLHYKDAEGRLDPLDRLKAVVRPDGGRTDFNYGDAVGNLYVQTLADLDRARRTESKQYFDGLGRVYRKATYENSVASEPWLNADTKYDALGRVSMAFMPYRSAGGGAPLTDGEWSSAKRTETEYDALGRVREVTTRPDGARVKTDYSGDRVLVTDQAGRRRISKTDALGRLREVWEVTPNDPTKYPGVEPIPPAVTSGLSVAPYGYLTGYDYDAPGNLREVTLGAQPPRLFVYDSLSCLTSATNPESGTVSYTYDENGNLLTKTDARGTIATYGYDALNRNVTVTYSAAGGAAATPPVTRRYDNPAAGANGLGRLWKSEAAQTALTTVGPYDAAGRPKTQSQQFWAGGVWGQPFTTQLTYNLAGGLISESYPSGHSVNYQFDGAARLGDYNGQPAFAGNLGGEQRAYSSAVLYDATGGMSRERFGTDTPLYHNRFYNGRGQLAEIRVGFYRADDPDPGRRGSWQRGAIINHYSVTNGAWGAVGGDSFNSGNLLKQDLFIPNDDAAGYEGRATVIEQAYGYDALNRLSSASEAGGASWKQGYTYDRWGNRTVNAAATSNAPATQFDSRGLAATNRLYAPGDLDYADPNDPRRRMRYDASGNLTYDGYTGAGARAYDAENRMVSAQAGGGQVATYAYDADGRRVKRLAGTAGEMWQVYGLGGELLSEYAKDASPFQPQKEYGYRGGSFW